MARKQLFPDGWDKDPVPKKFTADGREGTNKVAKTPKGMVGTTFELGNCVSCEEPATHIAIQIRSSGDAAGLLHLCAEHKKGVDQYGYIYIGEKKVHAR